MGKILQDEYISVVRRYICTGINIFVLEKYFCTGINTVVLEKYSCTVINTVVLEKYFCTGKNIFQILRVREECGGPQGQHNNIYSSTIIFNPVQQYLRQCKINHPSTKWNGYCGRVLGYDFPHAQLLIVRYLMMIYRE